MGFLVFLYLGLFSSHGAMAAASCDEVDLRGPDLRQARNQGDAKWCYAYAAADLLSYKMKEEVSAADVALNYTAGILGKIGRYFGDSEVDYEGGTIASALNATRKKGICREDDFHSDDVGIAKMDANGDVDIQIQHVNQTIRDLEQGMAQGQMIREILNKEDITQTDCKDLSRQTSVAAARRLFPLLSMQDSILTILDAQRWDIVRKFQEKSCEHRVPVKSDWKTVSSGCNSPICESVYGRFHHGDLLDEMDQQLNKKNLVGISYELGKMSPWVSGYHASTIAGRKPNPNGGECLYLIRDNAGATSLCDRYWQNKFSCDQPGYVWVPRSSLEKSVINITYLE
jgi:hypothetical protein